MEQKDLDVIKGSISEGLEPVKKDIADLKATSESVKKIDERLSKIEASPITKAFNFNHIPSTYKGRKLSHQLVKQREQAAREKGAFSVFNDDQKSEEYAKFMIDFILAKKFGDFQAQADLKDFYAKAALNESGTANQGSYLVPDEYLWDMVQLARSASFGLRDCSVVNMNSDTLYLPSETALPSVAWKAETVAATESEPTFGQVTLSAKRLTAYAIASNEVLADSAVDIVGILTEQFGYAIAQELDNQILNGTGDPLSGLLTAACGYSVVFATTSTNFSNIIADNYSDAIYRLSEGDLAGARFYINRIGLHYSRILKDSQNRPLFADLGGSVPGTLYGFPYTMSEKITNTSGVSTAMALFGNMKKFYIGRRLGAVGLDLDPYTKFLEYQTQFRIVSRWALAIGRSTAFCRIMTAAA